MKTGIYIYNDEMYINANTADGFAFCLYTPAMGNMVAIISKDDMEICNAVAGFVNRLGRNWFRYMFSISQQQPDGSAIVPPEFVARWHRQTISTYDDLPDSEKKSDIELANELINVLGLEHEAKTLNFLARWVHELWTRIMKNIFSVSIYTEDDHMIIPAEWADGWRRLFGFAEEKPTAKELTESKAMELFIAVEIINATVKESRRNRGG